MFEAELAGKLPEVEAYEDQLTSCVFGALRYLPPNDGVLPILCAAVNRRLHASLGDTCEREGIDLAAIDEAQFIFWPRSSEYGEPDLVVILHGQTRSFIIPIEVKYFAGKHGEQEDDQLMRYYLALSTPEARRTFDSGRIRAFSGELLAVVYVTRFSATDEIEVTLGELEARGVTKAEDRLFHLRWQEVHRVVQEQLSGGSAPYAGRVLLDIKRLLEHKHLMPFGGFSGPPRTPAEQSLWERPVFLGSRNLTLFPSLPGSLSTEFLSRRPVFFRSSNHPG